MFRGVLLSSVMVLAIPGVASAADIPDTEVLSEERIDDTLAGVNSLDQGLILLTEADPTVQTTSRTRAADGSLGPAQVVTNVANAEMPSQINFNNAGATFLSWGVATNGAKGQFTTRLPGGSFPSPSTYTTPACGRFQSVATRPDGGLLIACSANRGSAPTDDVVLVSGLPTFGSTSFEAPVEVQAPVDDNFVQPRADVNQDGVQAVVWSTVTEPVPGVNQYSIRGVINSSGTWSSTKTLTAPGSPSGAYGPQVAVLRNGAAAVAWTTFTEGNPLAGGLRLGMLNRDASLGPEVPVATKPVADFSMLRDGDGVLIAWSESNGFFGDPFTHKVVHFDPITGPGPVQTLESGSFALVGQLTRGADGTVAIPRLAGSSFGAWLRPPGQSTFGELQIIKDYGSGLDPNQGMIGQSLDVDAQGNVFASWILKDGDVGDPDKVFWGGLDFTGPTVTGVAAPSTLKTGQSGDFAADAVDSSGMKSVEWVFGDGQRANGATATHAYSASGTYKAKFIATDRAGNKTEMVRDVRVQAPTISVAKSKAKVAKSSITLKTKVSISQAGRVTQKATIRPGGKTACSTKRQLAAGTATLTCKMGKSVRKELRQHSVRFRVKSVYTPTGSQSIAKSTVVKVKKKA